MLHNFGMLMVSSRSQLVQTNRPALDGMQSLMERMQ